MRYEDAPNFLEALFGLIFEPGVTTTELLDRKRPPYALTLFFCFILTVFVPLIAQSIKHGYSLFQADAFISIFLTLTLTFVFFILMEEVLLLVLGIAPPLWHLFSSICYCLTPLMVAIWLIYLFNYLSNGSLTIVTLVMTGNAPLDDKFLRILPIALVIVQINIFLVLYYSLRFLGEMHSITAFIVTFISLVPFYISLVLGVYLGDMVRPGTIEVFQRLFTASSWSMVWHGS